MQVVTDEEQRLLKTARTSHCVREESDLGRHFSATQCCLVYSDAQRQTGRDRTQEIRPLITITIIDLCDREIYTCRGFCCLGITICLTALRFLRLATVTAATITGRPEGLYLVDGTV